MALSVVRLKREYEIRVWQRIIENNPYVAVVQSTGGGAWGRTNMKARILADHRNNELVGARFAVPRAAREGSLRTSKYQRLSTLFKTAGSAVVYGKKVEPVVDAVKQATKLISGAYLVGGRFGEDIITAATWKTVLESEGEAAEWAKFITVLGQTPPFIPILDRSASGVLHSVQQAGRATNLINILEQMGEDQSDTKQEAPS